MLDRLRPGRWGFYLAGIGLLAIAYALVLATTTGEWGVALALDVIANMVPVIVGTLAIRALWRGPLAGRPIAVTIAAHAGLAIVFAVFWFWLLMVLLGALSGDNVFAFSVEPFLGPAATWQLFQGLLIYAVIAMAVQLEIVSERFAAIDAAQVPEEAHGAGSPSRPFIKDGDELRPLDPERIVQIAGADDYAEVRTVSGTHMLRTTLAELERALGEGFLRVHRSHIVNIARIARIEPAGGGRLSLHMEGGETVIASRAGAKIIRERVL